MVQAESEFLGQCGRSSRVEFGGANDFNSLNDLERTICESIRSRYQLLIGLANINWTIDFHNF